MARGPLGRHVADQRAIAYSTRFDSGLSGRVEPLREQVEALEDRMSRLDILVGAIWELLEESGFSSDELWTRVEALDARMNGPASEQCGQCGSVVERDRSSCQICGEPVGRA
ncbi:MAG: hypothetical protein ACE5GC_08005 [Acidimicrobiia bacterium]